MTTTTTPFVEKPKPFNKPMFWLFACHAGLLILIYSSLSMPLVPPPTQGDLDDTRRFAGELVALNTTIGATLAAAGIIVFIVIGRRIVRRQEATPVALAGYTALMLLIFAAVTAFFDIACVTTATQIGGFAQ